MINLTSEWQKLGIEINGEAIGFEGRPLTKEEYLKLMPFMRADLSLDDTVKLIDIASDIIPDAVRGFEGLNIDGVPADPAKLCSLATGVNIIPHVIRELIQISTVSKNDEGN